MTFYVFFVIELATRRVEIAGITPSPNEAWMMQIGRNLTDPDEGFLSHKRFLIMDRDAKYSRVAPLPCARSAQFSNHTGSVSRLIDWMPALFLGVY